MLQSQGQNADYFYVDEPRGQYFEEGQLIEAIKQWMTPSKGMPSNGLIVVDSLNLVMFEVASENRGPIFSGGLVPGFIIAVAKLSYMAMQAQCALVAVLNSTLFPITTLEGAAEGKLDLVAFGHLRKRDRTDRRDYDIHLADKALNEAALDLQDKPQTIKRSDVAYFGL
jgi:hypothetical protein